MHSFEEKGGYEEAAYHSDTKRQAEAHVASVILVRRLVGEAAGEGATVFGSAIPLCVAGLEGRVPMMQRVVRACRVMAPKAEELP